MVACNHLEWHLANRQCTFDKHVIAVLSDDLPKTRELPTAECLDVFISTRISVLTERAARTCNRLISACPPTSTP